MMGACCCVDAGEGADVYSKTIRTARIAHKCGECGDVIAPGETYEEFNGCWDGRWSKYKTCDFCQTIRDDFFDCGWFFGRLVEDFYDCHGFDYTSDPKDWDDEEDD